MQYPTQYISRLTTFSHDSIEGQKEASQTTSPFGSPIDLMTQSLDLISPTEASSINESPVTLSPHADVNHHPYPDYRQEEYPQPANIDSLNSNGFGGTSYSTLTMDAVNAGAVLGANYNHNLTLDNPGEVLGNPEFFPSPNSFQYNPCAAGVDFSLNSPAESGQNFNTGTPFVEYTQHLNVDGGLSPNSSVESGGPQPQAADETPGEKTGPHYLIDLRGFSEDFLSKFCIKDNGNGTFHCDLVKCFAGRRASGSFPNEEASRHIREDIKDRPFVCGDESWERFKTKSDCERHVRSKNNPDAFECLICGKKCPREDALKQHRLNRHPTESLQGDGNNSKDQGHSKARSNTKKSTERFSPYNLKRTTD